MTGKPWLVKVRRYNGGESVVRRCETRDEALAVVAEHNRQYQSNIYYVEAFDGEKARAW